MKVSFELNAEIRNDLGKGASRRLRRSGKLPAILYGAGKDPLPLQMDHDAVMHKLEHEAFYSHILTVKMGGDEVKAVLKDLQRHPYKPGVLHMDLQRIDESEKLRMQVPLHFVGEDIAPGVKQSGGVISHLVTEVEITCLPRHLPEYIEVDVSGLGVNESLHLSDLALPEGVELVELAHGPEHDLPVVSIHLPRGAVEAAAGEEEAEAGEGEGEEA